MRILPILFNTEMVRAIMDGRKTVTRRICKDGNDYTVPDMGYYNADKRTYAVHSYCDKRCTYEYQISTSERKCPICPLDILYVRETWMDYAGRIMYKADCDEYRLDSLKLAGFNWHPSLHMPKEAARIFLKVKDVRVERLKDITDDGAINEGANGVMCNHAGLGAYGCTDCMNTGWLEPPILEFMGIWDSTIKKSDLEQYGWNANPWVWVIEFERCEKPE